MKFKGVIFDLDGTLLNTLDDLADSANHVLETLGLPTHDADCYRYFIGNGIPKLIERCLGEENLTYKEQALEMFCEYYKLHSADKTAPYDGIKELLCCLASRGIKLGVITNKAHSIAGSVTEHYLGKGVFGCIRGLDDTIKAKPDPTGALLTAKQLDISPTDILYVGDSGVDMLTAVNAGFTPCGALWGFRDEKELCDGGAVYLAHKPSDILDIIDKGI